MATLSKQLVEGLHSIDFPLGERSASLYVAVGDTGAMIYDTGVDGAIPTHVVPALAELGITPGDVSTVIVSHCDVDHFGGVADAKEQFPRARVLAHALDRPAIENYETYLSERARGFVNTFGWDEDPGVLEWCRSVTREDELDGTVFDGQSIDLGGREVEAWHVPGHTRGHIAINVPWADAVLVGDAVLGAAVRFADGSPAFPPTYRYVDDYLATIERLRLANHDRLLTAHEPEKRGEQASQFLKDSKAFVDRLDSLVIDALSSSREMTLADLLAELNPLAGQWPQNGTEGMLAFPVVGHLERFISSGTVLRVGEREGVALWSRA
jgi:glyoxylase-like metal-dependent hydrolase (beta-lactamase superfamily II)